MTALSDARNTPKYQGSTLRSFPVKGSSKIYQGSLVVLDAGYAKPGATATGLVTVGRAKSTVDNSSGADGDLKIEVESGAFRFANGDSIAQANVGALAYVVDDQTVAKAASGKSPAGTIVEVDSYGVWVDVPVSSSAYASLATTAAGAVQLASVQQAVGTMVAGSVTFAGLTLTASSVVVPIKQVEDTANSGALTIGAITPGAPGSVTITSADNGETSTIRALVIG